MYSRKKNLLTKVYLILLIVLVIIALLESLFYYLKLEDKR